MFVTAVCMLFLIKLRWPKKKSIYDLDMKWPSYHVNAIQNQKVIPVWNSRRCEFSQVNTPQVVWKFSQVRVIGGSICPTGAKIGSSNRDFREIGCEIIELEWSKFNGNKVWSEISAGSGNRGFEKSGFHCIHVGIISEFILPNYMVALASMFWQSWIFFSRKTTFWFSF